MKINETLRKEILQVVENQLKCNNPPHTRKTYDHLLQSGISEADAKIYIGQCVAVEIFNVMKHKQPFDEKRFIKNLDKLPGEPFEDE
jgi:hypothetical protein